MRMMPPAVLAACVLLAPVGAVRHALGGVEPTPDSPQDRDAFVHEPTESYTLRRMHGFTVRVSRAAMDHPESTEPALALLQEKLAEVIELTPEHTHASLRKVVFWIEHEAPDHPCACYHPSAEWLRDNGFNTDKAGGIEIANTRNFVEWTQRDQPLMILHELAHAYHHNQIGYDNELIRACYRSALESGKYDRVEHVSGQTRRHYALTNDREYFAELTESYFGRNDFAPFTRDELRAFDPEGYAMIEALWLRPVEEAATAHTEHGQTESGSE